MDECRSSGRYLQITNADIPQKNVSFGSRTISPDKPTNYTHLYITIALHNRVFMIEHQNGNIMYNIYTVLC